MSGHCYSCTQPFNFFRKEHGCKNCGFVFCKDCLGKKAIIPKINNEKHKVCDRCFNILSGRIKPNDEAAKYSPPDAYKKRVAALSNKTDNVKAVNTLSSNASNASNATASNAKSNLNKYRGMEKEDIAIAERLDNLKKARAAEAGPVPSQNEIEERLGALRADRPPPPTEEEMRVRLARLQGVDPAKANNKFVYQPDRRSEQHQVDDLLDQVYEESDLDQNLLDSMSRNLDRTRNFFKGQPAQDTKNVNIFENNLNLDQPVTSKEYTKNILPSPNNQYMDGGYQSISGERINWGEMQNLILQVAAEMDMDARRAMRGLMKDNEIRERLTKLKDKKKNNTNVPENGAQASPASSAAATADVESDEEDEDEQIKKIIKQALEEQRLEEELENSVSGSNINTNLNLHVNPKANSHVQPTLGAPPAPPKSEEFNDGTDPDELPWCCICNSDATLRCHGCYGDLYCSRCYKEGHDRQDLEDHPTSPYRKPSKVR